MLRFPADKVKRKQWLDSLNLSEEDITQNTRLCTRHFRDGDTTQLPSVGLGKRFYSPKKRQGVKRQQSSPLFRVPSKRLSLSKSPVSTPTPGGSRPSTPCSPAMSDSDSSHVSSLTASIGEQLMSDYSVHELPDASTVTDSDNIVLNAGMLSRIEYLEAELKRLKMANTERPHFRLEHITHDDALVRFYTGFPSYDVFVAVYEFLGPSVNQLHYWGTSTTRSTGKRKMKLDPRNQFFLTMIRLRLNLRVKDLSVRFGISASLVSRYVITWVCFLYQHLKEIEWMPTPEQVRGNLPHVFKMRYPSTYCIIDGSEVFIETPSDLQMQSSTWSDYKHHNTCKFLVACTPNGTVSFVSPLYVGAISDTQLTRVSGFVEKLPRDANQLISVMADRGFTIKDQLDPLGVSLNIPSFLDGRKQLDASEVQSTRSIASVRIHVERCIGRIKNFAILKSTLPLSMARIANQVVCVCAWLTAFQPALVPLGDSCQDDDSDGELEVDTYLDTVYDSDYDADSEDDCISD